MSWRWCRELLIGTFILVSAIIKALPTNAWVRRQRFPPNALGQGLSRQNPEHFGHGNDGNLLRMTPVHPILTYDLQTQRLPDQEMNETMTIQKYDLAKKHREDQAMVWLTVQPQPRLKMTRRAALASSFATAWSTSTFSRVACAMDVEKACQNGAMVPEEAIPGAYQQACMALSLREIPLESSGDILKIAQTISSNSKTLSGRTGVVLWNSSLLLTRLLDNLAGFTATSTGNYFTSKTVFELGCGAGLASVAMAKLASSKNFVGEEKECGTKIFATDANTEVLQLAESNLKLNSIPIPKLAQTVQLPWGMLEAMDYADAAQFMVGSDLTYNPGTWSVLAETVATILHPLEGVFLYVTCMHAGFGSELEGFIPVAERVGLKVVQEGEELWPWRRRTDDGGQVVQVSVKELLKEVVEEGEKSVVEGGRAKVVVFRRVV